MTNVNEAGTMSSENGYFAIGVYHPTKQINIGTLWRTSSLFGAAFIFTVGPRYHQQCSDTLRTPYSIPLLTYPSIHDLYEHLPYAAKLVCIELVGDATPLPNYRHPNLAIYLLGAEDAGLPHGILDRGDQIVIPYQGNASLNVAVAGSIVLYDREAKLWRRSQDNGR